MGEVWQRKFGVRFLSIIIIGILFLEINCHFKFLDSISESALIQKRVESFLNVTIPFATLPILYCATANWIWLVQLRTLPIIIYSLGEITHDLRGSRGFDAMASSKQSKAACGSPYSIHFDVVFGTLDFTHED